MRKLCKFQGEWKVIVNSRPKFSSGGWEVYIKCTGNQKWSKASNSKDKIGNLKETISFANKKMIELSQTQKEDYQGCDESTEQKPMKKKGGNRKLLTCLSLSCYELYKSTSKPHLARNAKPEPSQAKPRQSTK